MQDRNRSFLDLKSLFQSSRRPRSPTPRKTYHYKKKEWSSSGPKQSTVTDERTTYIIQRTLIDPHLSNEVSVFRQLSVREQPPSPPSQRSSLRPPRRSNDSSNTFHSDAMSSADSYVTLRPGQFPSSLRSARRSASPRLSQRRGGISSPELTPRGDPQTPSGLTVPPFSHVGQQTQNLTPRRMSLDKGDISYSRPTPFAYPYLNSSSSDHRNRLVRNRPLGEWGPEPAPAPALAPAPRVPGAIGPSPPLSLHSGQGGGLGRPTVHHAYRDRMLVHASVNKNWGTQ